MSGGMSPLTPGKGKFGEGGDSFSPDASRRFAAAAYEPEVLQPIRRAPRGTICPSVPAFAASP